MELVFAALFAPPSHRQSHSRGSHSLPGGAAPPAERLVGQSWIPPKETLRLLLTMVCGLGGITPGPLKIKMARNKFLLIQLVYY